MPEPSTAQPAAKCPVMMQGRKHCGREPIDDQGLCICHSEKPDKDTAAFQREIKAMLARKDYDFIWFVFPGDADFRDTVFDGPVLFAGATFQGAADFGGAMFQGGADFGWATFQGEARFIKTTFQGGASFYRARFQGWADFGWATFQGEARFSGHEDYWVFSRQADAYFRWARFHQPEKAVFQHVSLGRTQFLGTDVRQVDFTDVEWARRSGGRFAVWDELAPDEAKDYALIGKLYRQLKHNYEEQRDPITAGDFHFGEMEMRRLEKPPKNALVRFLKRYLSAIALYRWISGYGEDYIQALACIVGVLLAFSVVFAYIPLFALQPDSSAAASESMRGLGSRLVYSAMCFLLRGDRPLQPVYPPGYYWSVAEGVIGPPLIAMFILALNRRFKR